MNIRKDVSKEVKIENYGSDKGIQKKLRPEVSFFQEWPEILINTYY